MEEYNAAPFTTSRPYVVPNPQKEDIDKEVDQTLEQLPVLKQVLKHLDEKIASTDSVKKALELAVKYSLSKEDALIILDIVNQQLSAERSYIKARVERAAVRKR